MGIARLVQLFSDGKELVLTPEGGEPVLIWVAKLSAFQEEQANQSARVARARRMMAIREVGTPEYDLFTVNMYAAPLEGVIKSVMEAKSNDLFLRVLREIRSDPDWRERIELMEFTDKSTVTGPDVELMQKVESEYNNELLRRHDGELEVLRTELRGMPEKDVREMYSETYLEEAGYQAFAAAKNIQQVYLAMRACQGTADGDGRWLHLTCNHSRLFLDAPEEVEQLPPSVYEQVVATYAAVVVPPSVARFTDALPNSSESVERSPKEGDSTASSPEGTPTAPATT